MNIIALIIILLLIFVPLLGTFEDSTHHHHIEKEKELVFDFSNDPLPINYSEKAIGGDFVYFDFK